MSPNPTRAPDALLANLTKPVQWLILVALSFVVTALIGLTGLPAAILLGPMIAAIVVETNGGSIRLPPYVRLIAQAIVGCMLASTISPEIIARFVKQWPLLLSVVLTVILATSLIGWLLGKSQIMPGTTAVWGFSPGAATAAILMAGAYGADVRLVAFMQYLRVVMVVAAASIVAHIWIHVTPETHSSAWFPPIDWIAFAETIALAAVGGLAGYLLRFPAGAMLLPMALGAALQSSGIMEIELPYWLLAMSYAFIGWMIGQTFSRDILVHALKKLPHIVLAVLVLIIFCGGLAAILTELLGVDPLTAYLATSPGGLNSIAVIAASSKVDMSFIMALQTLRLVIVIAVGPSISRFVARRLEQTLDIGTLK
ncbi:MULTISPECIES: AbrB family transcriptional regulator [unclassified Hyphomicrobium]|uniref:AbrB family transcriptional regulator n=1 Tax=unclassified Hyphomicrobium TaxID=2619925 RepID=UPI000213F91A|nr:MULTISPECIES: AbrB family transcriptional regulator [unclassified Hyphomicrobium]CCB63628.1 Protein AbrB [Hyphomicrobium sp. MC1]